MKLVLSHIKALATYTPSSIPFNFPPSVYERKIAETKPIDFSEIT